MANVPLSSETGGASRIDLPDGLSEIFLSTGLDSPNQPETPRQIDVLAHTISMDLQGGK
jgi:hypothetical protein